MDRCLQAMVKNALEPFWEARFEGSSYGFRPGRSCHDAIEAIFNLATPQRRKKWVVDADIKGAFDNISHDFLLQALGDVPGQGLIKQWLKAGVMTDGVYHATEVGTPQGGVISPLLLNVALHGQEAALGVQRSRQGSLCGTRALVRYADDFVVFCESQEDAQQVKDVLLPSWLAERGLCLSEEKTRIVHLTTGFDFLGFNVKHYRTPLTTRTGYKLLITPSRKKVTGKRTELRQTWRGLKGHCLEVALLSLNPIIRGWANYYRSVVSSRVFTKMDHWMHRRTIRYVKHTHPKKPWEWLKGHYWGKLRKGSKDLWVFGNKRTGHHLLKFSWFKIVRHILVRRAASPDDPSLREYWWGRQKVNARHLNTTDTQLAVAQQWTCRVCGMALINGEELQRHHKQPQSEGGPDTTENRELVHLFCHQQIHAQRKRASRLMSELSEV
jgi:RNA-directed DNA polymerase